MAGIFGCVDFGGRAVGEQALAEMRTVLAPWGRDGISESVDGPARLGCCRSVDTPEAIHDRMPRMACGDTVLMSAHARLDNRDELCDRLDMRRADCVALADTDLVALAFERWGRDCVSRLHGDWAFAAWDRRERRLVVARDQHGMTSLYYVRRGSRFAFAPDKRALLPLLDQSPVLDEAYLAEILIVWPSGHGDKTAYQGVRRLCPAHILEADDRSETLRQYWTLDDAPDVRLSSVDEYAEAALEQLDRATRARLRSPRAAGISLSSGLDSCTVAAVSARALRARNLPLLALTAVPLHDATNVAHRVGNEFPLAGQLASRYPNIRHQAVSAAEFSPVRGIREMLDTHGEPGIAPMNQYWVHALNHRARDLDVGVMLTGQHGNATLSWPGLPTMASSAAAMRAGNIGRAAREALGVVRSWLPPSLDRQWRPWSRPPIGPPWQTYSVINPEFAGRLQLEERVASARHAVGADERMRSGRQVRSFYCRPGVDMSGGRRAHVGARFGFSPADPTRDVRFMELIQGMPNWVFRGPMDRWLVRAMTKGLVPDDIRLQRSRGQQAADLIGRLRQHPDELTAQMSEIASSPLARQLLDVPRLVSVQRELVSTDRNDESLLSDVQSILMSGLSVGAFLCGRWT